MLNLPKKDQIIITRFRDVFFTFHVILVLFCCTQKRRILRLCRSYAGRIHWNTYCSLKLPTRGERHFIFKSKTFYTITLYSVKLTHVHLEHKLTYMCCTRERALIFSKSDFRKTAIVCYSNTRVYVINCFHMKFPREFVIKWNDGDMKRNESFKNKILKKKTVNKTKVKKFAEVFRSFSILIMHSCCVGWILIL